MCSSRLCLVCFGLFVLSLLPLTTDCSQDEPHQNELYDKLNANATVQDEHDDHHDHHHDHHHEHDDKQINLQSTNKSEDYARLAKRDYFISKLFELYGNDKGVLTHEGLDNILKHLGFKDDHDHKHTEIKSKHKEEGDEDHDDHDHSDDLTKHSDEHQHSSNHVHERSVRPLKAKNDSSEKEKLHIDSLLQQYRFSKNSSITRDQFTNFCPGFVFMLLGLEHTDHEHPEKHLLSTEHSYPSLEVWGFSCVSVIIISMAGLLGLAVIPIMQKVFYNHLLQFLVALAVGALSGDALLHLIPHAFQGGHSNDAVESHDTSDHVTSVMKGLCGLLGIYFFFLLERLLTIHTQQKRKNKGKSKYQNNRTVYNEEQTSNFIGHSSNNQNHEPDCEDMVMGIHPGHKALKNFAEESHNKDCHKLDGSNKENHSNCVSDEEEPQLVLSHSHGGHGHSHCHKVPKTISAIAWMVILGDGIHNCTDGLAIGTAFASSITGGFSTSIAIFCHELPHKIGDFAVLLRAGMSVKQALVYNCVSSVLGFLGMIIGVFIGNIHGASLWIFVGVAGMFLYIALVDMLPQVSAVDTKKGEHPCCHLLLQMCGLILGGGIMLVVAVFEHDMMTMIE